MHDIKFIREQPQAFDAAMARRGLSAVAAQIMALDTKRRAHIVEIEQLQAQRNRLSKDIGIARKQGDMVTAETLQRQVAQLKEAISALEQAEAALGQQIDSHLQALPNLPHASVPEGADETSNVVLKTVGTPPEFAFTPQPHEQLGEQSGNMLFARAAMLSGARFSWLQGELARVERALAQFMLHQHTVVHGYTEVSPPYLVRDSALYGTGQLPKFGEDLFRLDTGHYLIPTAEVPLTNMVADSIVETAHLPLRLCAYTPCFRAEAGAAGRDTAGLIRLHQFPKVELVSMVAPDEAEEELERMTRCAEGILEALRLPYRRMALCAGDMGFAAQKTYDLEVWFPAQRKYREISSCSWFGDFQARRMKARFRDADGRNRLLHTLNGSALAVGRCLAALMENGQQADGSIRWPDALQDYLA